MNNQFYGILRLCALAVFPLGLSRLQRFGPATYEVHVVERYHAGNPTSIDILSNRERLSSIRAVVGKDELSTRFVWNEWCISINHPGYLDANRAFQATQKEIGVDSKIHALAFLPDERLCIVSGEENTIQLRQLGDDFMGQPIEPTIGAFAVAASKDGRWIVAGTKDGVTIWKRVENGVERHASHAIGAVRTIDISSDSKWVVTGSDARTTDIWDLSTGERVRELKHEYNVIAVKFCPCGQRLATATLFGSVRIFSTKSWLKLFTIPISVNASLSTPNVTFAWFAHRPQIFAVSQGQIKCLKSDDGSLIYQWPTRGVKHPASVILSPNHRLIAYTTNNTVVVRDTDTRQQVGETLKHEGNVSSISFSLKSDHLVVAADTKFTVWDLRKVLPGANPSYFTDPIIDMVPESCALHKQDLTKKPPPTTYPLPLMTISNDAVKGWLHSFLEHVEQVFSKEIERSTSGDSTTVDYNTYANRALIYARLGDGNAALKDAEKSLSMKLSAIGLIAKARALICQRKYELAKQEIPKLLQTPESNGHTLLLEVIQSILFCLSGEYDREISQLSKLSGDKKDQDLLLLLLVQANIHLFKEHFEHAMESFNKARMPAIFPHDESKEMWTIRFIFGWKFSGIAIQIQQRKCQYLLDAGNADAANLYVKMKDTYQREIAMHVELSDWTSEFRRNCLRKLKGLGDESLKGKHYKAAIEYYTAVEPLIGDLESKHELLLRRSKAYAKTENYLDALKDAQEAINLNLLSPWGYKRKYEVLYAQQHYHEAAEALDEVIKTLPLSKDKKSIELQERGVRPAETRSIVVGVAEEVFTRPRPHILINTVSGRLYDKQKQLEAFRAHPQYKKLILSPTSEVKTDDAWKADVWRYFRYSTLSHTWEERGEPEYRQLEKGTVYKLHQEDSIPVMKLKTFCEKTRDHGYLWAWSDTCCINKSERDVLDMSLRSMYSWYSESSLTIVHLKGVLSVLGPLEGDLKELLDELLQEFVQCRWNKRAWTLQEYFASQVIQFYTEEWKPYLPVSSNDPDTKPTDHKGLLPIQRGMQLVTGLDPARLAALKPGSGDVREKLRLASKREATRREDIAYSLLGIFKITLQAIYGDDEAPLALGRLLGTLLTKSAEVTILDWTGRPSEYNSCVPSEITVYHKSESIHIPGIIDKEVLAAMYLQTPPGVVDSAVKLHDRLLDALTPELIHGRLKLPCISFPVTSFAPSTIPGRYTATTESLEQIEIRTADDLSSAQNVFVVQPWYKCFLDPGIPLTEADRRKSAFKLFACLRQPFGALLMNWTPRGYERIAADNLVMVKLRENVSAEQLAENIRTLNIC